MKRRNISVKIWKKKVKCLTGYKIGRPRSRRRSGSFFFCSFFFWPTQFPAPLGLRPRYARNKCRVGERATDNQNVNEVLHHQSSLHSLILENYRHVFCPLLGWTMNTMVVWNRLFCLIVASFFNFTSTFAFGVTFRKEKERIVLLLLFLGN